MFLNKFKTGFPMCTSESDTQSPAELRVQYPTMPQLLPQPAAAKNSVLCARRALCFLARFAWRGGMPAPAQLALKARNGGRSASSRCLFFFSFSAKVSFVPRVALWTTNEKLVKSQQCLLFQEFSVKSLRFCFSDSFCLSTRLLIKKKQKWICLVEWKENHCSVKKKNKRQ